MCRFLMYVRVEVSDTAKIRGREVIGGRKGESESRGEEQQVGVAVEGCDGRELKGNV